MTKFVASNGMEFQIREGGMFASRASADEMWGVEWSANSDFMNGLREYIQHERDTELGRWRWPTNPDYVAYKHGKDEVSIIHEATGTWGHWARNEAAQETNDLLARAAVAYFAAHPEPKPWHDAKPGEFWAVVWPGRDAEESGLLVPDEGWPSEWECVTSARRIWPVA